MRRSARVPFRPVLHRLEDRTAPAAGMLDPTFGVGGRVTMHIPLPSDDFGTSTAVDSLGRIVVAGYTSNGSDLDIVVARYTPAGAVDTSFGGTGVITFGFGSFDDYASGVAIDSLDRILVAGSTGNAPNRDFAVARLTATGALDTTFDGDGKQTISFSAFDDSGAGVAVDSLDRVVIAGSAFNGSNYEFAAARLTVAGTLDSSFDGDGRQSIGFGICAATGVAVDSLNRVVVAGETTDGSNYDFALVRLTAAGALDSSFDGDGKQTIAIGPSDDVANGVAIDSLNRVVVAGYTFDGLNYDFAVARLTVAGTPDNGFDVDGKQIIDFGASIEGAICVAVDSMDRVVVAGGTDNGTDSDLAVARLTVAGALDASFDGDGKRTIAFGASTDYAYGVAVDSTDRVAVAGNAVIGASSDIAVARLTVAGALDSSFSGDGKQTLGFTLQSDSFGTAVAVDSQGRTVIAGYARDTSGVPEFAVTRLTSSGALDTTFGGTGIVTISFGNDATTTGVAIDSLDRVVVVGYRYNGSDNDFAVARLTAAGALDATFDGDGKQIIAFGEDTDIANGVAVDSLNRIVVAGYTNNGANIDFAVARLTAAGAPDSGFDGDGKQTIVFGSSDEGASGVAVDSLDRVVVAGSAYNGSSYDFAVARLTPLGALDNSFDGDGKQTVSFGPSNDGAQGVTIDSLGRIVLAGGTTNGATDDFAVARLTPAGALDNSFDGDGKQTVVFGASNEYAFGVAVDSLNRVFAAGYTTNGSNVDFAVARLTAAGALDSTFDGDGKQTIDFGGDYEIASGVAIASADRVVLAGSSNHDGYSFAVARLTGDTTVAVAQVNDGSVQRSRVTSITVRFSSIVAFSGPTANAFTLVRTGGGAVNFTANVSVENGGTVVVLTNFTGSETEFGSLRDGRYTLTALAAQISAGGQALDGDADGAPGGNFVFGDAQGLFRFYGDINGDRHVDIADFGLFSQSIFNPGSYNAAFDFNNDGVIDIADFGQFSLRIFTVLP
jgi:uncharacterized delta-60 repeat protein